MLLHPWNHAPRQLPQADFEKLRQWWTETLQVQHSSIADALTGRRLDVLQQCVAIEVTGDADLSGVRDVHGLSEWLHSLHSARSGGKAISAPGAALLSGPPKRSSAISSSSTWRVSPESFRFKSTASHTMP